MDHSTTKYCSTEVFKLKSNRLAQGNDFCLNFSPFDIKLYKDKSLSEYYFLLKTKKLEKPRNNSFKAP